MPSLTKGEVVATRVSYRPLAISAGIPENYPVPAGVDVMPYELTSIDHRAGIALHLLPRDRDPDAPIVISVHGSGGSVMSQPNQLLSFGLSERGTPVLAINTRQSGEAVNTDSFYATVRDIDAAYWMARDLGYERIAVHGHSLGTSQVSFFAATHWYDTTVGIILTGMFADLPWKTRHLLINNEETYAQLTAEAIAAVHDGDHGRILATKMKWLGGRVMPVSAQHFLTYRRTELAGARSVEWIARVPNPLLMVRDEHDPIIEYFEPNWMEAAAASGLSPRVQTLALPSREGSNGHAFETSGDQLVAAVDDWLRGVARPSAHGQSVATTAEIGRESDV